MIKMGYPVKLELHNNNFIKAPDFCVYSNYAEDCDYKIVNASICTLCKKCDFISEVSNDFSISLDDMDKIKTSIISNKSLMESFMKQINFLQKKDRIPIAAFISFSSLQNVICSIFDDNYSNKIINYIINAVESPLCIVYGIPLYFNRKLTKSEIQVVGEVEWKQ